MGFREKGHGWMRLVDEIIDLAVDDKTPLPVILRKCLVLAHDLKNERLKTWVEKELDGYAHIDDLPDYRRTSAISKGISSGPFGAGIENHPIATANMTDEHRAMVENATFRSAVSAYQPNVEGEWNIPWNPNLVARYKGAFYKGYFLVQAWIEVPGPFVTALLDTVRNRVLKLALELRDELGLVNNDPVALPFEVVDRTVVTYIYGGHNVIAQRVEGLTQAGPVVVVKGDVTALRCALERLGVADSGDVQALEKAIVEDTAIHSAPGLGGRTLDWIKGAAFNLVSKGGDAALEVAKAQMTTELTRVVSQYLGLA
jgi:hypothetical protein